MASIQPNLGQKDSITVFCNENTAFNRNFLALVKHWDRRGKIQIMPSSCSTASEEGAQPATIEEPLLAVDENGVRWNGAEAVPIIFKNLPFGKLAAAMYILPGTMWVTRQLCEMDSSHRQLSR
ncbi:MAG: hypothetical protein C5B53_05915 [Candidatus Melainabacteria bacterium]|nr:MAG: hypothetical protein C5B53_05915 [Candidatus Melainabacteria bacterium]